MLRGYDDAIDWNPDDPRLDRLADAAARLAERMTMVSDLPSFDRVPPGAIDILTGHLGIDSPAWARLDELLTRQLAQRAARGGRPPAAIRSGTGTDE